MQADGERLGSGRLGQRRAGRYRLALRSLGDDVLAKRALFVGKGHGRTVKAHVEAMLGEPLCAITAAAAGPARIQGDGIALLQAGDAGADRIDGAGDLMAENHRFSEPDRSEARLMIVVQIRAADAAGTDRDTHLAVTGCCDRVAFDPEIIFVVEAANPGFHG